jgi:hypothetical protein
MKRIERRIQKLEQVAGTNVQSFKLIVLEGNQEQRGKQTAYHLYDP